MSLLRTSRALLNSTRFAAVPRITTLRYKSDDAAKAVAPSRTTDRAVGQANVSPVPDAPFDGTIR